MADWLKFIVLAKYCTDHPVTPQPKENPTQYWFGTRSLSLFSALRHRRKVNAITGKPVKVVPQYLKDTKNGVTRPSAGARESPTHYGGWLLRERFSNCFLMYWIISRFPNHGIERQITLAWLGLAWLGFGQASATQPLSTTEAQTQLHLVATKKKRGDNSRIRFSSVKGNLERLRSLEYMHPLMVYKLGI